MREKGSQLRENNRWKTRISQPSWIPESCDGSTVENYELFRREKKHHTDILGDFLYAFSLRGASRGDNPKTEHVLNRRAVFFTYFDPRLYGYRFVRPFYTEKRPFFLTV